MSGGIASKGFATRAVHAVERAQPAAAGFLPISTPIYSSASFLYDRLEEIEAISAGERPGFIYSRHHNPTNAALEEAVSALEGGGAATCFASGMAAMLLALLSAGAEQGAVIVASQDLYGVTMKALVDLVARWGVAIHFVDLFEPRAHERVWALRPRILLLESLTNPLLRIPDLPGWIEQARAHGTRIIVDNTFATPVLVRPLEFGADFVIHSATKYLGGHGDLIGGILACRDEFVPEVRHFARLAGAVLGPFEAWLTLRGLKTLPLRFHRQCENAWALAQWLEKQPRVERVHYPALASHPDHERARTLFGGMLPGGVVAFTIRDAGRAEVFRFVNALELFLKATSMGDLQSLVLYPAISSHRDLSPKHRERLGITESLVRLSVGIEDVADLQADLAQALARV